MDSYHVWCGLKPGVSDIEFVQGLEHYLNDLKANQQLVSYLVTRAKPGFKPSKPREFHITLDFLDLTQLSFIMHIIIPSARSIGVFAVAPNSQEERLALQ
jgi:hypothetical protein